MSKYDDLVTKLKEIFQIDQPELDFGVYRILNARAVEINDYLENRLKAKVSASLATAGAANTAKLQKELQEKQAQYRADGIDPDTVPKLLEIKHQLAQYSTGSSEHENTVFSHLLTFFSRYYDSGDFISQRRYKGDTYAIPYAGEEVVLHWANKDQYYTKSGENFANYAFKLDDGRSVRFRLIAADTAKDNRKDNDKERRFVLLDVQTRTLTDADGEEYQDTLPPISEEHDELVIRFEYKAMPKGSKQDALVQAAVQQILDTLALSGRGQGEGLKNWHTALSQRHPTEKNPQRTLLEKMLTRYTSKNTADYFIHKDLGGFLRRELDFYIKNEVMNLDDVQTATSFADIEKNLRLIQTLRAIALDLITFLAQLEDFQKKLWLKKKFVVASHYCLTLDRVPEDLYPTIAANPQQWQQWQALGMLDGMGDIFQQAETGSVDYLKEHPFLMVDTALFAAAFKHALLAAVDNLDDSLDGLLVHGDNFQALNLLQERYREQVKCVYIDPPYNTGGDGFTYKDNYQHSSWLSMLYDRLKKSLFLMSDNGLLFISIDESEITNLRFLVKELIGNETLVGEFVWKKRAGGDMSAGQGNGLVIEHEYVVTAAKNQSGMYRGQQKDNSKFSNPDNDPDGAWTTQDLTCNKTRNERPSLFYDLIDPVTGNIFKCSETRVWSYEKQRMEEMINRTVDGRHLPKVIFPDSMDQKPKLKKFIWERKSDFSPISSWLQNKVVNSEQVSVGYAPLNSVATREFSALFGEKPFMFPKSSDLIKTFVEQSTQETDITLDYFAGSGTTAHAVINLNREDASTGSAQAGKRKYILVEQGDYFDTVLKPRIQKVVYSADWKDGKATAPHTGISHAFKILKLESYEDTLNNLNLRRSPAQQDLLTSLPESAQDDYLLRYLLDIESRGSLLSVAHFDKPFAYQLKVSVDSAGAYQERAIDLVETFNYLIGLRVQHINSQPDRGFVIVIGWLPTGEKTLILWRDVEQVDYEGLNRLCAKLAINPANSEFELVYINGDHNIPTAFTSLETEGGSTKQIKIRQIEAEFLSRMFN